MIRLVVDANVLVGELLRLQGLALLRNSLLALLITERARDESQHELRRRVQAMLHHGRLAPMAAHTLLAAAERVLRERFALVPVADYAAEEAIARRRIPRDSDDWPTVAAALATQSSIWTNDADFLGCAVPVWTTQTLRLEHRGLVNAKGSV